MMRSTREPSSSWGSRERSTAAVSTSSSSWWMGPASCPCAYLQQSHKAGVQKQGPQLWHGRGPTDEQSFRDGHQLMPPGCLWMKAAVTV